MRVIREIIYYGTSNGNPLDNNSEYRTTDKWVKYSNETKHISRVLET